MDSLPPFVDSETRSLDTGRIWQEAAPLAGLVVLFGGLALVPMLVVFLVAGNALLSALLTVVAQFILAVGAGIVLLYVVARGIQIAQE